jgi:adenylate cyclase
MTCELIRDVMDRFTAQIIEQGGVIVDYAGDGILAMWNAPVSQEDHAHRACRAALAMLAQLPELNNRWQSVAGVELRAGIGINTGTALVGNTGSNRKLKYGPHGSTVNLASRVQDATKKLGLPLLITHSTQERLPRSDFVTRRLCTARMPGIHGTAVLFELRNCEPSPCWIRWRDEYEAALADYETGEWGKACQRFVGLMELGQGDDRVDVATVKLVRKAWEFIERREGVDPVIDLI